MGDAEDAAPDIGGPNSLEDEEDDLANELEADLEKELAFDSDDDEGDTDEGGPGKEEQQGEEGEELSEQTRQKSSDEAGDAQPVATAPAGLAAVLQLRRQEEDPEVVSKAEQNRRNAVKLGLLTEEQLKQFEAFRRSKLDRRTVSKLMQSATHQPPNPNAVIVVCGVAKMFVGDLIETARAIAGKEEEVGPLRPSHVHQAYQVLERQAKVPHARPLKRLRLY